MDPSWQMAVGVAGLLLVAAFAVMARALVVSHQEKVGHHRQAALEYARRMEVTKQLAVKVADELRENPKRPLTRADAFPIARAWSELGFAAQQTQWWPVVWSRLPEDGGQ